MAKMRGRGKRAEFTTEEKKCFLNAFTNLALRIERFLGIKLDIEYRPVDKARGVPALFCLVERITDRGSSVLISNVLVSVEDSFLLKRRQVRELVCVAKSNSNYGGYVSQILMEENLRSVCADMKAKLNLIQVSD